MQLGDVLAIVERLGDVEFDLLDRDELAEVTACTAAVRGWLDALELRCSRRGRTLAQAGAAEPAPSLIARHTNRSSREACRIERRDRVAEALPTFEDGLSSGTVSAAHLDAIADATRNAPAEVRAAFAAHEDELLAHAVGDSVETFIRRCRALVAELTTAHTGNDADELNRQRAASSIRTWVTPADGLHHTLVALDPLRHEILWTALNRSIRRRQQLDGNARTPWNQIQTDALIDAVTGRTLPVAGATATPGATSSAPVPTRAPAAPAHTGATRGRPPSPAADIADDLISLIDQSIGHGADNEPTRAEPTGAEPTGAEPDEDDLGDEDPTTIEAELRRIEQRLPEVSVLTDFRTIVDGLHQHSISETENGIPLPVSTMRRLCCDAEVLPIVLGGDGIPLDVGRTSRTVTRGQRRALRAMHRSCANRDCTVPFSDCKIHHVQWWQRDLGPTDIDNLIPLCERCHHLVHEGGWTLTMTPDRVTTWTRPDGTIHHHGSCIDRPPPTGPPPTGPPTIGPSPTGSPTTGRPPTGPPPIGPPPTGPPPIRAEGSP
jgi:hypothetical protein